jgi:hypothetical protein
MMVFSHAPLPTAHIESMIRIGYARVDHHRFANGEVPLRCQLLIGLVSFSHIDSSFITQLFPHFFRLLTHSIHVTLSGAKGLYDSLRDSSLRSRVPAHCVFAQRTAVQAE